MAVSMMVPRKKRKSLIWQAKQNLRFACPQSILNWREEIYYRKYGEAELHVVEFLCRANRDAIDVGAHEGCYVYPMKRYAKHVLAFEPLPWLAEGLIQKFGRGISVRNIALSRASGKAELRMPLVDGIPIQGCASLSLLVNSEIPAYREVEVGTEALDAIYDGDVGFMKIDVEGFEDAVLDGARATIARCLPNLLIEIDERMAPGGVKRVSQSLAELHYKGFFIDQGRFLPIDLFDVEKMQRVEDVADLTADLSERPRFPTFINNFLFLSPATARGVHGKIAERIATL